ncbi:hypothetical protein OH76DRAFT_868019 [Lentinus brumalis]|uniref:Uncharacterized protein n=1 Tax=Lentinus brumalis TaxID=2498619 RepID=A0A371DRG3_9APHY|nr:hypothetical protein OH76DRAFT_868019 [Polyporus brumalis]
MSGLHCSHVTLTSSSDNGVVSMRRWLLAIRSFRMLSAHDHGLSSVAHSPRGEDSDLPPHRLTSATVSTALLRFAGSLRKHYGTCWGVQTLRIPGYTGTSWSSCLPRRSADRFNSCALVVGVPHNHRPRAGSPSSSAPLSRRISQPHCTKRMPRGKTWHTR